MASLFISDNFRASALPIEIYEHIIDSAVNGEELDYELRGFLFTFALVCRSWTARVRHHLLKVVALNSSSHLDSFLLTLSTSPIWQVYVRSLHLGPGPGEQDCQTTMEMNPSISPSCEWGHKALLTLPTLLPGLGALSLSNLFTLQPNSIIQCSRFSNVTRLTLIRLKHNLFREITRLINGFAKLRILQIQHCTWPRLSQHQADKPWTEPLVPILRDLYWYAEGSAFGLSDVLLGCSQHLSRIDLAIDNPGKAWGEWVQAFQSGLYLITTQSCLRL